MRNIQRDLARASLPALAYRHREEDMLRAGIYQNSHHVGEPFKGCSVGCFAHDLVRHWSGNPHHVLADRTGVPSWWWWFQDTAFERLDWSPLEELWHVRCARSVAAVDDWDRAEAWFYAEVLQACLDAKIGVQGARGASDYLTLAIRSARSITEGGGVRALEGVPSDARCSLTMSFASRGIGTWNFSDLFDLAGQVPAGDDRLRDAAIRALYRASK